MTVTVRVARPEEYDAVGELTADAYVGDGLAGGDYAELLRDAPARAAVAELLVAVDADGRLLGTATLVPPDAPPQWRETDRAGAGTIRMLATAKPARGMGAGAALTADCIDRARRRGWQQLTLVTQPAMQAAHRLYQRAGFVRDTDLDFVVGDGLTLVGYSLDLG